MTLYYQDEQVTLYHGDALDVASVIPSGAVNCIVTSPPYYGLRDYGVDGQYGTEPTVGEYVDTLVRLFRECRRVLANDGTFWLNLGDSYGPGKQFLMVPARVAIALQADGWVLRNDIVWHKTNALPESVKDRLARRHEHVYMFTKSAKYRFDLDPIREPHSPDTIARANRSRITAYEPGGQIPNKRKETVPNARGKNPGDVWAISNTSFKGAHFATFPPEIPRRAILAGSKSGGTVLDPFSGSGTTGVVAKATGRRYIGIDINAEYLRLSLETRLQNSVLDFGGAA